MRISHVQTSPGGLWGYPVFISMGAGSFPRGKAAGTQIHLPRRFSVEVNPASSSVPSKELRDKFTFPRCQYHARFLIDNLTPVKKYAHVSEYPRTTYTFIYSK
jgi:hypothetical protein